jgi:hypothetical protein
MKIDNPPSPPFRKGGMGGFDQKCLIIGKLIISYYLIIGAWNLVIIRL